MSRHWPKVRLGEVLRRSEETAVLQADTEYSEITVRLWGKGVVERGCVLGAEIAGNKRSVAREGQFIASRIDARNGAMGIVPAHLDGAVVTNDFPLFNIDAGRLLPAYFRWLSGTQGFVELCLLASEGTTNRVRLKEDRFLALEIPLPPLAEQRRIVTRIEELAAQIHEACTLRHETADEVLYLFEAAVTRYVANLSSPWYPLGSRATKIGSGSTPLGGRSAYPSAGIPFVRSLNVRMRAFQWDDIAFISSETHARMAGTAVKPNDVLLNITGASIGRVACAPPDLREANVNQHVAIIRPDAGLDSKYLMYWLSQQAVQETIHSEQKGATRQGFTKAQISAFEVPIPPLSEQRRIVTELDALQAEVDTLKRHQRDTAAELDALLPALLDRAFRGEL